MIFCKDLGNKFDWEGVRRAFEYYDLRGVNVQGVCKNATARLSPVPADLKSRVIVTPIVDSTKDVDDLATIRLAMAYKCQFVDNDNYRDWKWDSSKRGAEPDIRQWLAQGEGRKLKVTYVFDSQLQFIPSALPPSAVRKKTPDPGRASSARRQSSARKMTPDPSLAVF